MPDNPSDILSCSRSASPMPCSLLISYRLQLLPFSCAIYLIFLLNSFPTTDSNFIHPSIWLQVTGMMGSGVSHCNILLSRALRSTPSWTSPSLWMATFELGTHSLAIARAVSRVGIIGYKVQQSTDGEPPWREPWFGKDPKSSQKGKLFALSYRVTLKMVNVTAPRVLKSKKMWCPSIQYKAMRSTKNNFANSDWVLDLKASLKILWKCWQETWMIYPSSKFICGINQSNFKS